MKKIKRQQIISLLKMVSEKRRKHICGIFIILLLILPQLLILITLMILGNMFLIFIIASIGIVILTLSIYYIYKKKRDKYQDLEIEFEENQ